MAAPNLTEENVRHLLRRTEFVDHHNTVPIAIQGNADSSLNCDNGLLQQLRLH